MYAPFPDCDTHEKRFEIFTCSLCKGIVHHERHQAETRLPLRDEETMGGRYQNLIMDAMSASSGAAIGWIVYSCLMSSSTLGFGGLDEGFLSWTRKRSTTGGKQGTHNQQTSSASCPLNDGQDIRHDDVATYEFSQQGNEETVPYLRQRIQELEEENQRLSGLNRTLAIENRQLSERIIEVAFVDHSDEMYDASTSCPDFEWCWWEEAGDSEDEETRVAQDDQQESYRTPEKSISIREENNEIDDMRHVMMTSPEVGHELKTPPIDSEKCVKKKQH